MWVLAVYFGGLRGWENVFPKTGRKSASCRICPIKPTNIPEGGSTKGSLQQYTQFLPEDLAELKNSEEDHSKCITGSKEQLRKK